MENNKLNIAIIGTGKLAWHLATAFCTKGVNVVIFGRNELSLNRFKDEFGVLVSNDWLQLSRSIHIAIIAVSDDIIAQVSNSIPEIDGMVVHTSGSVSISVLVKHKNRGVLYPLQSFSHNTFIDWKETNFLIESNTNLKLLQEACTIINSTAIEMDSTKRQQLHLAAVFACNFSQLQYILAYEYCQANNIDFQLLQPLITHTAKSVNYANPLLSQTGPARRNDQEILNIHLRILNSDLEKHNIYALLSEIIKSKFYK